MIGRIALAAASLLLLAPGAGAKERADMTPDDILDCVEESAPRKSTIQTGRMRIESASGATREAKGKAWWGLFDDLSHILVDFSAPEDLRGSKLLVIEKPEQRSEMFMYLPEFKRTKRVSGRTMSASVFGSDFSYEDVEQLYRLARKFDSRRLDDTEVAGRPAFVVESRPPPDEESTYERIVETVEHERCVVLQLDFYEQGGELLKVVTFVPERIVRVGEAWIPEEFTIADQRDGGRTTILVDEIEVDPEISKRLFSESRLSRGN